MKGSIGKYGDTMAAFRVRGGILGFGAFATGALEKRPSFFRNGG